MNETYHGSDVALLRKVMIGELAGALEKNGVGYLNVDLELISVADRRSLKFTVSTLGGGKLAAIVVLGVEEFDRLTSLYLPRERLVKAIAATFSVPMRADISVAL